MTVFVAMLVIFCCENSKILFCSKPKLSISTHIFINLLFCSNEIMITTNQIFLIVILFIIYISEFYFTLQQMINYSFLLLLLRENL